jgi:hypothetical protein
MGFYSPAVLVKDAQRHGLRVRPIDVQRVGVAVHAGAGEDGSLSLRMGMNYAKGLRQSSAEALIAARGAGGFPERGRFDAARAGAEPQRAGGAGADWRAEFAGRSGTPARCAVAGGVGGKAGGAAAARSGGGRGEPQASQPASQRVSKSGSCDPSSARRMGHPQNSVARQRSRAGKIPGGGALL